MINFFRLVTVIQMLETGSSQEPAHARNGSCYGWLQMKPAIVEDYNRRNHTDLDFETVATSLAWSRFVATDHFRDVASWGGINLENEERIDDLLAIWRVGYTGWREFRLTPKQQDYVERGVALYEQERKGGRCTNWLANGVRTVA
jgi:hypothetical protein